MAQHHTTWPVAVLCDVLEVSRSGFYTYVHRHAPGPKRGCGGRSRGAGEGDCSADSVQ